MIISKKGAVRISIPHEPGEWMEFVPLNWTEKKAAIETARAAVINRYKDMFEGFSEAAMKGLGEREKSTATGTAETTDELDQHYTLVRCINAWSYDGAVTPGDVSDLDAETADWAFQEALKLCGRKAAEGEGFAAA